MNKNNNLNSKRLQCLKIAKTFAMKEGWNDNIFEYISKHSSFKLNEVKSIFPAGYKSLLELYLKTLDDDMTQASKKLNLIRLKTPQRIKEIILLRLKQKNKEKKLFKKTIFTLFLPYNSQICTKTFYNTIDQIWYLAGDNSSDFNFYTKRILLSGIYSSTLLKWINDKNNDFKSIESFLDNQLQRIAAIPKD